MLNIRKDAITLPDIMICMLIIGIISVFWIHALKSKLDYGIKVGYWASVKDLQSGTKLLMGEGSTASDGTNVSKLPEKGNSGTAGFCNRMSDVLNTVGTVDCTTTATQTTDFGKAKPNFVLSNGYAIYNLGADPVTVKTNTETTKQGCTPDPNFDNLCVDTYEGSYDLKCTDTGFPSDNPNNRFMTYAEYQRMEELYKNNHNSYMTYYYLTQSPRGRVGIWPPPSVGDVVLYQLDGTCDENSYYGVAFKWLSDGTWSDSYEVGCWSKSKIEVSKIFCIIQPYDVTATTTVETPVYYDVFADINGLNKGNSKLNEDVFEFWISLYGNVYPAPKSIAADNTKFISAKVTYQDENSNWQTLGSHFTFKEAMCLANRVNKDFSTLDYCGSYKPDETHCPSDSSKNTCKVKLNQPGY